MRALSIGIAIAIGLAIGGCDQKSEKKKDHVSITGGGHKITIQSDKGQAKVEIATDEKGLSVKTPDFVSIYPGAKVLSSLTGADDSANGGGVAYTTSASPADVIAFYRKKAKAEGMKETMNAEMGGTRILAAKNEKTGESFHVNAVPSDGGTQASLFWSKSG
jgi:hypothetical protein